MKIIELSNKKETTGMGSQSDIWFYTIWVTAQVISIIELQIQKKKSEDYNDIFEG